MGIEVFHNFILIEAEKRAQPVGKLAARQLPPNIGMTFAPHLANMLAVGRIRSINVQPPSVNIEHEDDSIIIRDEDSFEVEESPKDVMRNVMRELVQVYKDNISAHSETVAPYASLPVKEGDRVLFNIDVAHSIPLEGHEDFLIVLPTAIIARINETPTDADQ